MKKIISFLFAVAVFMLIPATAFAGTWKQDGTGWWYQNDNGTYKQSEWYTDTNGSCYYFGADGYMLADTMTPDGYYVNADGVRSAKPEMQNTASGSSSGSSAASKGTAGNAASSATDSQTDARYIIVTSTNKFHLPSCPALDRAYKKNKTPTWETRDALIKKGYIPCKKCNP